MATTDAKPGFRLPWSSDRSESGAARDESPDAAATGPTPDQPVTPVEEPQSTAMIDAAPAAPLR